MTDVTPAPEVPPSLLPITIKDQLGNEYLLHAFPEAPFGLLSKLQAFQVEDDPIQQVNAVNAVLNMAFPAEESNMLANLVQSPGGPSMNAVMGMFQSLMESWFGRPTTGPSESSPSDGPTNTSSEEKSLSQAEIPQPSAPETGLPPVISS